MTEEEEKRFVDAAGEVADAHGIALDDFDVDTDGPVSERIHKVEGGAWVRCWVYVSEK